MPGSSAGCSKSLTNCFQIVFARMLFALTDELGLERCIAPELLSPRAAKQICLSTLEQFVGPLPNTQTRPQPSFD